MSDTKNATLNACPVCPGTVYATDEKGLIVRHLPTLGKFATRAVRDRMNGSDGHGKRYCTGSGQRPRA